MTRWLAKVPSRRGRSPRGPALLAACLLAATAGAELHVVRTAHGPPHAADGPVSVDARHARQRAHLEHSSLEVGGPCAACVLSGRSKIATRPLSTRLPAPRVDGEITPGGRAIPFSTLLHSARGRAPPLL